MDMHPARPSKSMVLAECFDSEDTQIKERSLGPPLFAPGAAAAARGARAGCGGPHQWVLPVLRLRVPAAASCAGLRSNAARRGAAWLSRDRAPTQLCCAVVCSCALLCCAVCTCAEFKVSHVPYTTPSVSAHSASSARCAHVACHAAPSAPSDCHLAARGIKRCRVSSRGVRRAPLELLRVWMAEAPEELRPRR